MLNPSTADAHVDDPTIRRCIGFAKREHCGGLVVANLCAYRATRPAELAEIDDPEGPQNLQALARLVTNPRVRLHIAAWGASRHATKERIRRLLDLDHHVTWRRLGHTNAGHPRHPLYVRADTPLDTYPALRKGPLP